MELIIVNGEKNFYRIRKIINTKNGKVYQYQFVIVSINGKRRTDKENLLISFMEIETEEQREEFDTWKVKHLVKE